MELLLNKYPTKQEILDMVGQSSLVIDGLSINNYVDIFRAWRKVNGKKYREGNDAIKHALLDDLIKAFNVDGLSVVHEHSAYYYNPTLKKINLGHNPSIISALHELGHALFGRSELKACAFSVRLFMDVYPRAFTKLIWRGHMLIKPITN